jgi:serine protease AprX
VRDSTARAARDAGQDGRGQRGQSWTRARVVRGLAGLVTAAAALTTVGVAGPATAATYNPATDPYSMAATTANTGATAWWNAGYTGRGVDVAVIDTGVARVPGLDGAGKVINGPDLSMESQNTAFRYLDTNGHGTFMAGLIAGHDAALTAPYASAPASAYRGIAPDARIVNVKVGIADGGVDVSEVITAIDWVVQHKNDPGMNIRVLNLSYGTNSTQSYLKDPLAFAVEQAWKKGIVVVAASGNSGYSIDALANPATDPYVIAVGATDSRGTSVVTDDTLGSFSAHAANGMRAPDFAAPGSHLQGLRVPGSYVDETHPEGLIDSRYFRGSGTSEAAAVTSGAAALILQKYPTLTPDQVKNYLRGSTYLLPKVDPDDQGAGEIRLAPMLTKTPTAYTQTFTPATGTGTLEAARGTEHLSMDGVVLSGEKDIFGQPFNSAAMATAEAAGSSWAGGTWNGKTWAGSSWAGSSWAGSSWAGSSWAGSSWAGKTWASRTWAGSSWAGSSWAGSSWAGSSWAGSSWAGGTWT